MVTGGGAATEPVPPACGAGRGNIRARRRRSSVALRKSGQVASAAGARAMNTRSCPGSKSGRRFRTASRTRRFTPLRTTALPTRFPTEIPSLVASPSFGATYRTRSGCPHERRIARTRWNSAGRRRRCARRMTARPSPSCLHDRQAQTPTEPPAAQHMSATPGGHSLEEAVLPLSWDALRLIRSLRHTGLLSVYARLCCDDLLCPNCTEAQKRASTAFGRPRAAPARQIPSERAVSRETGA
jgi:hypothetical protein